VDAIGVDLTFKCVEDKAKLFGTIVSADCNGEIHSMALLKSEIYRIDGFMLPIF
jgi:hypothetical protein